MSIALRSVLLQQPAPVELYVLDLEPLGGEAEFFCPQVNELNQAVVWQGQAYQPFPIEASGFEARATGSFPRPRLSCSNVLGSLGPLMRQYGGLRGARLIRKRTMALYLDAVNFAAGNADADPLQQWPDELWIVDECTQRNRLVVAFTLRNPLDFTGVMLPGRVVEPSHCPWRYRSSDCGYTGGPVAKVDDTPTAVAGEDRCSKRPSGCKLRFPNQPLPGGFFPGVGTLRAV